MATKFGVAMTGPDLRSTDLTLLNLLCLEESGKTEANKDTENV